MVATVLFDPIVSVQTRLVESLGGISSYFRTRQALTDEIQSLKDQLQERSNDALTIAQLQKENAVLDATLGLKTDSRIVATVLVRPNQTPYDTFLIDRGARDGIVLGTTVYTGGNIAIGSVARAYSESSLVRLVSSPGARATAYIFGPNIFTVAEGMGGGVLRVKVPQGIPLAVGNLVVLPAAGAGAYGQVVNVESLPSSPEQYGYVTSSTPLQSVRFVSVAREVVPDISYQTALDVIKNASSTLFTVNVPSKILVGTTTIATTTMHTQE
jgi:hypothetical protein